MGKKTFQKTLIGTGMALVAFHDLHPVSLTIGDGTDPTVGGGGDGKAAGEQTTAIKGITVQEGSGDPAVVAQQQQQQGGTSTHQADAKDPAVTTTDKPADQRQQE